MLHDRKTNKSQIIGCFNQPGAIEQLTTELCAHDFENRQLLAIPDRLGDPSCQHKNHYDCRSDLDDLKMIGPEVLVLGLGSEHQDSLVQHPGWLGLGLDWVRGRSRVRELGLSVR